MKNTRDRCAGIDQEHRRQHDAEQGRVHHEQRHRGRKDSFWMRKLMKKTRPSVASTKGDSAGPLKIAWPKCGQAAMARRRVGVTAAVKGEPATHAGQRDGAAM
jgi:hypothetical protein